MAQNVVPFGKYKGQPVEALAQDRDYVDWLLAQPWLKNKHQNLYTLIINNFTEPSETPEHNAVQALFLDNEFVEKVISIHYSKRIYAALAVKMAIGYGGPVLSVAVEVEGADVYVAFCGERFAIEVKPSVGDDYPAILRQIKNIRCSGYHILFLERYIGSGATKEQFVAIFRKSGVAVVFREDAEKRPARGWAVAQEMSDKATAAEDAFIKCWTNRAGYWQEHPMVRLRLADAVLLAALDEQREMFRDAIVEGDESEIRIHGEALCRGWAAANRRMEEAEIAKAKAIFPGAKVTRVRDKSAPDRSGGESVS